MDSNEHTVSEYFRKADEKRVEKENPNKRTRSELSSTGSDCGDINQRILDELLGIKDEQKKIRDDMQTNVKKDDLKDMVNEIVCGVMGKMKTEIDQKFTEMKSNYDQKIGKLKDDYDKLYLENQELRGKIQERKKEMQNCEKVQIEIRKTAEKAHSLANRNEQYSRKTNIKVHGIPEFKYSDGRVQSTQATVCKVLKDSINVELTPQDIIAAHRIPGSGAVNPILLKVKNTEIKSKIMRKRKVFKEKKQGAKLSDDVTRENSELIRKLLEHKDVTEAWYFNCQIYARLRGMPDTQRVRFDICDNIDRKIRKKLSKRDRDADPSNGYATESDTE